MSVSKLISFAVVLPVAFAIQWSSLSYFSAQEIEKAAARLTLYRSSLEAELRHCPPIWITALHVSRKVPG